MELTELTPEERVALVGLLEVIVGADRNPSDEEAEQLDRIIAAMGEDAYRRAAEDVDRRFHDEKELRVLLQTIERPEARELIYETAVEAALPDSIESHVSELLGWLAQAWGLTTRFQGPEDA